LTIDQSHRGTVVLFALNREASPFLRLRRDANDVFVGVSGVGADRARAKLDELLSVGIQPNVVIAAGYAGALRSDLGVGDVVVAAQVIDASGHAWATSWPAQRSGRILTSDHLVGDPAEKSELGQRHRAEAVDMESAAIAAACQGMNVPFACVRAISDDAATSLSPRLLRLLAGGRVGIGRICRELVRRPGLIVELIRLGRDTKRAGNELARVLWELLMPRQT
jgi:adenosylhomocysteine nucleosidase